MKLHTVEPKFRPDDNQPHSTAPGNMDGFVSSDIAVPFIDTVCELRRIVDGVERRELAIYHPMDISVDCKHLEYKGDAPWRWRNERYSDHGVTHWRPLNRRLEQLLADGVL